MILVVGAPLNPNKQITNDRNFAGELSLEGQATMFDC